MPQKHQLTPPEAADPLAARAGYWDIREGHHPRHAGPLFPLLSSLMGPRLPKVREHLPLALARHGHHTATLHGPRAAAGVGTPLPQEDTFALAPLYVRDLAGRVVLLSTDPLPQTLAFRQFPAGSSVLPADHPLLTAPDEEFFCLFRLLEWSPYTGTPLTGAPQYHVRALYQAPHHYPSKIRVDSFYQDGFRLPQTTRLAVQPSQPADAALAVQEFEEKWKNRPANQLYEDFYEANNGEAWFEELFQRGCTIIPTLEACNGFFQVTDDFGIADVWPGRAVEGLHKVVDTRPDASPSGTILEVKSPGYLTQTQCTPASVVVSDGSGYASAFNANPPFLPNLNLPHPRAALLWGSTWLPTHPSHFEAPALWEWDSTGHFVQSEGPLWDPLHYIYASTPKILKAFRNPFPENPARAPVPEDMRPRFHPLIEPTWYDTVNDITFQQRQTSPIATPWQHSRLDSVPIGTPTANIGYHPLPAMYEYELDLFAFPEVAPPKVGLSTPSTTQSAHLLPPISPLLDLQKAQKMLVLLGENPRQEVLENHWWKTEDHTFPDLRRYQSPEGSEPPANAAIPCYLAHIETSPLMVNVKRLFNKPLEKELEATFPNLAAATYGWVEESLAYRRRQHRLARKYPGWYRLHWWQLSLPENDTPWQQNPDYAQPASEQNLRSQGGAVQMVEKPLAKSMAVKAARRLPASQSSAKVAY